MKPTHLTRLALLTAVALTMFVVEQQLPPLAPIPGIKLGLANAVTLYVLRTGRVRDAALVLAARIILGNLVCGTVAAMLYAAGGGLCAFAVMALLRRAVLQTWVLGVLGALGHSLGQMAVAVAITATPALLAWLPVMLLASMAAGAFSGLCVTALLRRLKTLKQ